MAINTDLLIAAPMLQDALVDKDGLPLSNGIVTLWEDTQRYVNYKNWYYQTGSPGAYSWIPLDNPMHLSAAGTIQDPNGNDIIPFYYPFDENNSNVRQAYFITVYSADENGDPALLQFTRENFPFNGTGNEPGVDNPTFRNYIINNTYWRNIGAADCMDETDLIIAPSQHDGYTTNGDIRFLKNVAGADDDLIFSKMTATLENDVTPEYYINFTCGSVQSGETVKCIQYPISMHVQTLQNRKATLVMQTQNVAGTPNNYLDLYIYQFMGTGALIQPAPILIQRITIPNTFTKFVIPFIFPNFNNPITGLVPGVGGDDALFLRVQYPLSAVFANNHTKPQIYLSEDVPDNDFDTYDQVGAIFDSARTGDHRISLNPFQPYGWVPANDGTIGNDGSGANTRANSDTWPLYRLIYTSVFNIWAPVTGGRTGTGTTTAEAYADFSANKTLMLTRQLGRVISGVNPAAIPPLTFTTNYAVSHFDLTVADSGDFLTASPVQLLNTGGALPSGLTSGVLYAIIRVSDTVVRLARTIEEAYAGTAIDILSNSTGTSTIHTGLGAYNGETLHSIAVNQLPQHTHFSESGSSFVMNTTIGGGQYAGSGTGSISGHTGGVEGFTSQSGLSLIQPTAYRNIFFKL